MFILYLEMLKSPLNLKLIGFAVPFRDIFVIFIDLIWFSDTLNCLFCRELDEEINITLVCFGLFHS